MITRATDWRNPKIDASDCRYTWGHGNVVEPEEVQPSEPDKEAEWIQVWLKSPSGNTMTLVILHRSLHVECNNNVTFKILLFKTMERYWRQDAEISRQSSISPPPCSMPQDIALLRHAPASASLSGQNPNSGNILQPSAATGLFLQRLFFLWRASKWALQEADGGSVWSFYIIFSS